MNFVSGVLILVVLAGVVELRPSRTVHVYRRHGLLHELDKYKSDTDLVIFVLFTAERTWSGRRWCPDSRRADPVVEDGLNDAPEDSLFIICVVGDRFTWKDPQNEFRVDTNFALTSVPTLMKLENKGGKHKQTRKLVEAECANLDLVKMLFSED